MGSYSDMSMLNALICQCSEMSILWYVNAKTMNQFRADRAQALCPIKIDTELDKSKFNVH